MLTVSDLVFQRLSNEGIDHVFLIPGDDPYMHVAIDTFCTPIIMRDERAAAFAAQIYARIKGLGVCVSSHGPGMTNLVTGLAAAFLENDKVISISSQLSSGNRYKYNHAYISEEVLSNVTKKVLLETESSSALNSLESLIQLVNEVPTGPTAYIIPHDVSSTEVISNNLLEDNNLYLDRIEDIRDEEKFAEIVPAIQRPNRTIALVGSGPLNNYAIEEVQSFLNKISCFTFTTLQAKGITGRNNDFTVSRHNLQVITNELEFDLCLLIGVDKAEGINITFKDKPVISFVDNQNQVQADINISGSFKDNFKNLTDICITKNIWYDETSFIKHPVHIVEKLAKESATFDGTICIDTGLYKHAWASYCTAKEPLKVIFTNGLSSIGWSVGAAIGAYFATMKPVMAVIGDGGFSMAITELFPIMQYDIPVSIIVIKDNSYGMIKRLEIERLGESSSTINITSCDIKLVAKAFGFDYLSIDENNFEGVFKKIFKRTILEINVNYSDYKFSHH